MKVRELIMLEMAPFHDMNRAPFEFNVSNMAIEEFANATHGGRQVHAGAINKLGAGALKQRSVPEKPSIIENGWGSRRYNFILKIEHDVPMGPNTKIVQYLSGYTDSSFAQRIMTTSRVDLPSDLMFRFTNNITVSEVATFSPSGQRTLRATPMDAYNILTGAYDPQNRNVEYSTRVQDTLAYSSTARWIGSGVDANDGSAANMSSLMSQFRAGDAQRIDDPAPSQFTGGERFGLDGAVAFSSDKVKHAHASSVMPTDYLGKAFHSMALARDTASRGSSAGAEADQLISFAMQDAREASIVKDRTLGHFQRDMNLTFDGAVDWHTLKTMFGDAIDSVTHVFPYAEAQRQSINTQGSELGWAPTDSQTWNNIDMETVIGRAFAVQLPAAMSDRLVEAVRFRADNYGRPGTQYRSGMWAVDIVDCRSYIDGYDRNQAANQLRALLESTVLPSVVSEHNLPVSLVCGSDLWVDTQFKISVNGQQQVPYTQANFSPCAVSPLMNRDINQVHKLSTDLVNLVAAVTDTSNF